MAAKQPKATRGIRNNNPGNIRKSKDKWQGLASEQPDREFSTFKDATYGIRAMARILIKYQDDYKADTIVEIVNRWAPPVENNTEAYINQVAVHTGRGKRAKLDMHKFEDLFPVVKALIIHENGYNPYTDAQITKGLVLAGVEPSKIKEETVLGSKETKVATVGAAATVTAPLLSAVDKYEEHSFTIDKIIEYGPWAMTAVMVVVCGYFIYLRWDDRRKGIK